MSAAAIRGTFSDFKIIRGRKCAQLVIEVPLEEADRALAALGGIPQAATERWVAVARLNESAVQIEEKPKRRFSELSPAQQAGIKCQEPSFWRFLNGRDDVDSISSADSAAMWVRFECGVKSRADLNTDPASAERWLSLLREYETWMLDPVEQ